MEPQSVLLPKNQEIKLDKLKPREKKEEKKNKKLTVEKNSGEAEYGKKVQKEGEHDAYKDIVKEQTKQHEMVEDIINKSNRVLLHVKAVFPFDLFPNELIIDLAKVTFVMKEFFGSGTMEAVYVKDIADVIVETGPVFSTLRIVDISFGANKHFIHYLKKKDAFRARELIEGLITASKEGLDLTKLEAGDVISAITKLSGMQKVTPP
jgi:hypothetical protein